MFKTALTPLYLIDCITVAIAVFFHRWVLDPIYIYDQYGISYFIIAVYIWASLKLLREASVGVLFVTNDLHDIPEILTKLGLAGTIIGIILATKGFVDIDIANIETVKAAIVSVADGIGLALITTIVGLTLSILIDVKIIYYENRSI